VVDLSPLRFIITGGAPVPERLIRACLDRGVTLQQGYGLSEAAPVALLLDAGSAMEKIGSAGKPVLFVDVRIVRPDGTQCLPGETGELLVAGPNVMQGYWRRDDATRDAIDADGWLHSGDAARSDNDDYIWIVDRLQDRYSSDGQFVYLGDVERVLMQHPAVADAGVVGTAGNESERGVAFVVLADDGAADEAELLSFCRQSLAAHQVPASIAFIDVLPRSSVGKLLRHELRQLAAM
jgi:fatty-acyl-CoA synthase